MRRSADAAGPDSKSGSPQNERGSDESGAVAPKQSRAEPERRGADQREEEGLAVLADHARQERPQEDRPSPVRIGNIEATAATAPPCGGLPGARGIPASPWVSPGHRAILIALPDEGALATGTFVKGRVSEADGCPGGR